MVTNCISNTNIGAARYNTMVVFLFRPSPQVPKPSVRAAQICFEAAKYNIYLQKDQIQNKSSDLTWVYTQGLFMAFNAVLWAISYSEVRSDHPRAEIEDVLNIVLEALYLASVRWPGVEAAFQLYGTLSQACMKTYDGDSETSYSVGSPKSHKSGPVDSSIPSTSASMRHDRCEASSVDTPLTELSGWHSVADSHSPMTPPRAQAMFEPPYTQQPTTLSPPQPPITFSTSQQYTHGPSTLPPFDSSLYSHALPTPMTYGLDPVSENGVYTSLYNQHLIFDTINQQYLRYMQTQYMPPEATQGLSLQQQSELMNRLELRTLNGTKC